MGGQDDGGDREQEEKMQGYHDSLAMYSPL